LVLYDECFTFKAWDDHWSKLDGDGEIVWGPDAKLTPLGIEQAQAANQLWRSQVPRGIPIPDAVYTSPLSRSIDTADITFRGWYYAYGDEPGIQREFGNRDTLVLEVSALHI
jgi:broad specificity phosphatase PhoE